MFYQPQAQNQAKMMVAQKREVALNNKNLQSEEVMAKKEDALGRAQIPSRERKIIQLKLIAFQER
jgi:hypothetical protein